TPLTIPSRPPPQPPLGSARTASAAARAACSASEGGGRPRPQPASTTITRHRVASAAATTRLPRRCPLLGHERDVLLGGALQAIAEHAGQVQEDLGRDARVAKLDAAEEALVHREDFEIAGGDHVGAALGVAHEPHLAEHVAPPVLGHPPPLLVAACPHLGAATDDDEHLVAQLAAADDRLAGREAPELAHQDDDARLRRTEAGEERDRPGRLLAEL